MNKQSLITLAATSLLVTSGLAHADTTDHQGLYVGAGMVY